MTQSHEGTYQEIFDLDFLLKKTLPGGSFGQAKTVSRKIFDC